MPHSVSVRSRRTDVSVQGPVITLIVRPILVPSFLAILWRRADARADVASEAELPNMHAADDGHGHNVSAIGRTHASELSGSRNR